MKTLIKRAHVLTMDDDFAEHHCADIVVEGTKWVDEKDIELLTRSGWAVGYNSGCNLRLGSGVIPCGWLWRMAGS